MLKNFLRVDSTMFWQTQRLIPKKTPWYSRRIITEHLLRYRFAANFVKNQVVADIACGVGYGCMELAKAGAKRVIGIDNSKEAIGYARQNYRHKAIQYLLADAAKTGLPIASCDLVTSFETIEHLTSLDRFMAEVGKILRPGGVFIISTPNKAMALGENPFHQREYTLAELSHLLSGFRKQQFYAQTRVNPYLTRILQMLWPHIPSCLRYLLSYRPWEQPTIDWLPSFADTAYRTIIVLCYSPAKTK